MFPIENIKKKLQKEIGKLNKSHYSIIIIIIIIIVFKKKRKHICKILWNSCSVKKNLILIFHRSLDEENDESYIWSLCFSCTGLLECIQMYLKKPYLIISLTFNFCSFYSVVSLRVSPPLLHVKYVGNFCFNAVKKNEVGKKQTPGILQ